MIELTTAVEKTDLNPDFSKTIIPAGSVGELIDIIIENGKVLFLLDFEEFSTYEWYEIEEVEEKC